MKKNETKNVRKKPITKTFEFIVTGKDSKGYDYDTESLNVMVKDLQNAGVFDKLSIPASAPKSIVLGKDDAKGNMNVARVMSFDVTTSKANLLFFGKNIDIAEKLEGLVLVPRVRLGRDNDQVETILSFDLVNAMDA